MNIPICLLVCTHVSLICLSWAADLDRPGPALDRSSPDGPGRKTIKEVLGVAKMEFKNGPYFQFDGSNKSLSHLSNLVSGFYFEDFTLLNHGNCETDAESTLQYTVYQNFEQSMGHSAERVYGEARGDMDVMSGNLMIKTPKTNGQFERCRVVGVSRRNRPDFDGRTGTANIFIFWDDTIIKKPFKYVTNNRFIDSTWPVGFHYNFHIDPNCSVNFSVKERNLVEETLDGYLVDSMRVFIFKVMRENYMKNFIIPYLNYIESKNW